MKTAEHKSSAASTAQHSPFFSKGGTDDFAGHTEEAFFTGCADNNAVQTKLTVGPSDDKYEREADRVADTVVQNMNSTPAIPGHLSSVQTRPSVTPLVQTKCAECEEEEKQQDKEIEKKGNSLQPKPAFESNAEPEEEALQMKCDHCEKEEKKIQRKSEGAAAPAPASVVAGLSASRGGGSPLSPDTNASMSSAFGRDFSEVRVHTGQQAAAMNRELNAQAFTHGNDIYFGEGKYSTADKAGNHLLAHELTHTLQQGGAGRSSDSIHKKDEVPAKPVKIPEGFAKQAGASIEIHLTSFPLKQYASVYNLGTNITAPKGKRETKQKDIWKEKSRTYVEAFMKDLIKDTGVNPDEPLMMLTLKKNPDSKIIGSKEQLINEIAVPFWDKGGNAVIHQVEHAIDWQILGKDADHIDNLLLLDKQSNLRLGNAVSTAINDRMRVIFANYKTELPELDGLEPSKARKNNKYILIFDDFSSQIQTPTGSIISLSNIIAKSGVNTPYKTEFFHLQKAEIPKGHFLLRTNKDRAGYLLPYSPNGNIVGRFNLITEGDPKITSIYLDPIINGGKDVLVKSNKKIKIENEDQQPHIFITNSMALAARMRDFVGVKDLSPIKFSEPELTPGLGLRINGFVDTDVPFLKDNNVEISFELSDSNFIIQAGINDIVSFPKPFNVSYSSLFLRASSNEGLAVGGELEFGINKLGKGKLSALAGTSGFAVAGKFEFESKKFEGSNISFTYKDRKWTLGGELIIKKGNFKGIETANLTVKYAEEKITAKGKAKLDVPGIDDVTLDATIDSNGNFSVKGDAKLKKMPGIKGGSLTIGVNKENDDFNLTLGGTAAPDIPKMPKELDAQFTISYDSKTDVFKAAADFKYKKGRVEVKVLIGVTNAAVADGILQQTKADKLVMYGTGEITVTLIENKVTGKFKALVKPTGELFISGVATLVPTPLMDPFKKEKTVGFPSLKIPIVGVPMVSIFLEIGGGVKFYFDWTPLTVSGDVTLPETDITKLDQATLGMNVKANSTATAGVGMEISAKIGAQAIALVVSGGVSGFAGLEITGNIGAGLKTEFSLDKGLVLKSLDAEIDVKPKAKFSLSGVIDVYLDLFFSKVNIWEWRKQLAEGSIDLSNLGGFKITVPVKFDEKGKLMLPSLEQIQVQKPEFSAAKGKELMEGVFNDNQKQKPAEEDLVRQRIQAGIDKDVRTRLAGNVSHDVFAHARDVENKFRGKNAELNEFIRKTVRFSIMGVSSEAFDKMKNDLLNSKASLASKLAVVDEYERHWYSFYDKTATPLLREELRLQSSHQGSSVQRKPIFESENEEAAQLQRQGIPGSTPVVTPHVASTIESSAGKGESLSAKAQQEIGAAMGADLSDVNIHRDANAASLSDALNAKAFTHGQDIYFNRGEYDVESAEGKHLLAHELAHVVQQENGRVDSPALQRQPVDDSPSNVATTKPETPATPVTVPATPVPAITTPTAPVAEPVSTMDTTAANTSEAPVVPDYTSWNYYELMEAYSGFTSTPGPDQPDYPMFKGVTTALRNKVNEILSAGWSGQLSPGTAFSIPELYLAQAIIKDLQAKPHLIFELHLDINFWNLVKLELQVSLAISVKQNQEYRPAGLDSTRDYSALDFAAVFEDLEQANDWLKMYAFEHQKAEARAYVLQLKEALKYKVATELPFELFGERLSPDGAFITGLDENTTLQYIYTIENILYTTGAIDAFTEKNKVTVRPVDSAVFGLIRLRDIYKLRLETNLRVLHFHLSLIGGRPSYWTMSEAGVEKYPKSGKEMATDPLGIRYQLVELWKQFYYYDRSYANMNMYAGDLFVKPLAARVRNGECPDAVDPAWLSDQILYQWSVIAREENEMLARFASTMKEETTTILNASEKKIRSEAARLGVTIPEEALENNGAMGMLGNYQAISAMHQPANEFEVKGTALAAKELLTIKRELDEISESIVSDQLNLTKLAMELGAKFISDTDIASDELNSAAYVYVANQKEDAARKLEIQKQKQLEYNTARRKLEAMYPGLASAASRGDTSGLETLSEGGSATSMAMIGDMISKLKNIRKVKAELGDDISIWELQEIIPLAKLKLMITQNSFYDYVIESRIIKEREDKEFWETFKLVVGIGLAIASFGSLSGPAAALVIAARVGTVALDVYEVYGAVKDYNLQSAMSNTDFDLAASLAHEEPSMVGVFFSIVAAVADIGEAKEIFKAAKTALKNIPPGRALEEATEAFVRTQIKDEAKLAKFNGIRQAEKRADEAALRVEKGMEETLDSAQGVTRIDLGPGNGKLFATPYGKLYKCSSPCQQLGAYFEKELSQNSELAARLNDIESRMAANSGFTTPVMEAEIRQLTEVLTVNRDFKINVSKILEYKDPLLRHDPPIGTSLAYKDAGGTIGVVRKIDVDTVEISTKLGQKTVRKDLQGWVLSPNQANLPTGPGGFERLHASGPIIGHESPYGILYGPHWVNHYIQKGGIERILKMAGAHNNSEISIIVKKKTMHLVDGTGKAVKDKMGIVETGDFLDSITYRIGTQEVTLIVKEPNNPLSDLIVEVTSYEGERTAREVFRAP